MWPSARCNSGTSGFAAHVLHSCGYLGPGLGDAVVVPGRCATGTADPPKCRCFLKPLGVAAAIPRFSDLRPSTMSTDSTVPQPRVIVLCFDGTSNQYDATVSLPDRSSPGAPWLTRKSTRTRTSSSFMLC